MTTIYARNFETGRDDKAAKQRCMCPATIPDMNAYRGYMDGWSGREFNEPNPARQVAHYKNFTKEVEANNA